MGHPMCVVGMYNNLTRFNLFISHTASGRGGGLNCFMWREKKEGVRFVYHKKIWRKKKHKQSHTKVVLVLLF